MSLQATIDFLGDCILKLSKARDILVEMQQNVQTNIPMGCVGLNSLSRASASEKNPFDSNPFQPAPPKSDPKRAERSADGTEKRCNKCGDMKKLVLFPPNKSCADGFAGTCKICVRESKRLATDRRIELQEKAAQTDKLLAAQPAPAPAVKPPEKSSVDDGAAESDKPLPLPKIFKCKCGKLFRTHYVFVEHQEKCQNAK